MFNIIYLLLLFAYIWGMGVRGIRELDWVIGGSGVWINRGLGVWVLGDSGISGSVGVGGLGSWGLTDWLILGLMDVWDEGVRD